MPKPITSTAIMAILLRHQQYGSFAKNNHGLEFGHRRLDTQPAVAPTAQKVLPQSTSTRQNYVVDVTDYVQSWVNKPDSNFGVLLRLQLKTITTAWYLIRDRPLIL